ncbi:MAG: iron-containing alcohol dehydrogenase [Hydrotalea sp.]|nr:iron-containing alcohol dehydrogenase [Hydrotalea sp.]
MTDKFTGKGNFSYPTKIWAGAGRVQDLPAAVKEVGFKNPLLVTDKGLATMPLVKLVKDILSNGKIPFGFFAEVQGNPTETNVNDGLKVFRDGKHDGVILLGGGSGLDAGKTIAFMAGQTRPMWDFEDIGDWWTRANPEGIVKTIAIPTTAGTGSEVGRASVILNEQTHEKKIIFHPLMLPSIVIQDPELTFDLPPFLTVATGMDALTHCIESFACPNFHPICDGVALQGMRLIKKYLPIAFKDGKNTEARSHMLLGSAMGAMAFQKNMGAVHSIAHPVGGFFNAHHGLTNGVLLPYVMEYNQDYVKDRYQVMAHVLGLKDTSNKGFIDWLIAFKEELGVPKGLRDLKVTKDKFSVMAEHALRDPNTSGNSRPMTLENFEELIELSY